jgi:hypothetical protein
VASLDLTHSNHDALQQRLKPRYLGGGKALRSPLNLARQPRVRLRREASESVDNRAADAEGLRDA